MRCARAIPALFDSSPWARAPHPRRHVRCRPSAVLPGRSWSVRGKHRHSPDKGGSAHPDASYGLDNTSLAKEEFGVAMTNPKAGSLLSPRFREDDGE